MTPRYVVLCLQGFGDALEATPMVQQLRRSAPAGSIAVVTMRPQVRDLFLALPALADRVLYVPYWEKGKAAAALAALRLPFRTNSDASFLAYPSARVEYGVFARSISSARHFAHAYPRSGPRSPLERGATRLVPIAPKHNVLRNLDLLSAAGVAVETPEGYVVPDAWRAERTHPGRVLVHIGSIAHDGLEQRRWPAASFLALVRELQRASLEVAFISGPAEREATTLVARDAGNARIFEGPLPEIARTIANSGAVVANDSGIAHLAAGVRTPVVALMGPTPAEHGPYGPGAIAYRPSACPPCFDIVTTDTSCIRDIDYACLKRDIRPAEVASLVIGLLRGAQPRFHETA